MTNFRTQNLLRQIDEVMHELPWLYESFDKKFRDITEADFFALPAPGVHSVAENMSHLIEWRKELVIRLETGQKTGSYDEWNWIDNEVLKEKGMKAMISEFEQTFIDLKEVLSDKNDEYLNNPYYDKDYGYLLEGWLHHDVYHLGQIGLILSQVKKSRS